MKCLIVKPSSLGDILQSLPAVFWLKKSQPFWEVVWLAKREYLPLLKRLPFLDRVLEFPRERFRLSRFPSSGFECLKWLSSLRRERFDVALDLQGLLRSGLISYFSGAPLRIGLSPREGSFVFYTHPVFPFASHAVERYLEALCPLGISPSLCLPLPFSFREEEKKALWEKFSLSPPYGVFSPFARWASKELSPKSISQILRSLLKHFPFPWVVVGGKEDREKMAPVLGEKVRYLVGETSLWEWVLLVQGAKVCLSVESATFHLACLLGIPLVGLFGPNRVEYVGPWGRGKGTVVRREELDCLGCEKRTCPRERALCLEIPLPQILQALQAILQD